MHHIPKTAGTSMGMALAPYCRNPLLIENPFKELMNKAQWKHHQWNITDDNYFRLIQWKHHEDFWVHQCVKNTRHITIGEDYTEAAFVRNPFDAVFASWDGDEDFDDFVKYFVTTGKVPVGWQTQLDFISDDHGKVLLNFIGRFETLEKDWVEFTDLIGLIGLELPQQNMSADDYIITTGRKSENYKDHYTSYSKDAVAKKYRDDLKYFGYEFDGI
tara:strand:- start:399 stop:1046 length:648 start_codon:yes stop_codon:yes gene_type:complete